MAGSWGTGDCDTCGTLNGGEAINFPHDDPEQAQVTFSSHHTAGANFGFVDGSVHFVRETIEPETLANLGTVSYTHLTLPTKA